MAYAEALSLADSIKRVSFVGAYGFTHRIQDFTLTYRLKLISKEFMVICSRNKTYILALNFVFKKGKVGFSFFFNFVF